MAPVKAEKESVESMSSHLLLPVLLAAVASAAHRDTLHTPDLGESRVSSTPVFVRQIACPQQQLWLNYLSFSNLPSKGAGETSWKTVHCSQLMLVAL